MASKSTNTRASNRRPGGTKKTVGTKKAAPRKSTAPRTKKPVGRSQAGPKASPDQIRAKNQRKSVVMFAAAIFNGCLVLVPGDSVWRWLHNLLVGIFGGWAILGPILMLYIAVVTAMNRQQSSLKMKIWISAVIIALCCACGYIFSGGMPESIEGVLPALEYLYTDNVGVGGGVIGGLIGVPLLAAAGNDGAKIIVILLLFVTVMILTGTTLIQLFTTLKKPVSAVSDGIHNVRERREEKKNMPEPDIADELSDALPMHPVHSDPVPLFPESRSHKDGRSAIGEKLSRLREVFGIKEEIAESAETPIDVPVTGLLQNEFDEISGIKFPFQESGEPETEAVNSGPVSAKKSASSSEAALDAANAAKVFLEKQAKNLRNETNSKGEAIGGSKSGGSTYCFPPVTMLEIGKRVNPKAETDELQTNGRILVETLKSFGVQSKILDICRGPSVTRYELQPAAGVKISKITNLSDDLAMNLAAIGVRIEAPIPGKAAVGIEVPNKIKTIVRMRELIESNAFAMAKSKLTVALGRDIAGQVMVADLAKMPHLLIAGTTGSGKSVCINSLIVSTLYKATPEEVRFLMIDPKVVELGIYNGIPHLLVPVVTDPRKAAGALGWAVSEMLNRYKTFADNNVRDLQGYNQLAKSIRYKDENGQPMLAMPQIIIIIDELSDLMMAAPNEVEDAICRLAQMARAAGMHLVVATQRPSVDVVTGLIKANIPSRIAFAVSSTVDSRTILDGGGAEKLLGQGDMLFSPVGVSKPVRVQGCFVSNSEIESITEFAKNSRVIEYDEAVIEEIERNALPEQKKADSSGDEDQDSAMEDAIQCVVEAGQASTSLLQRRLRLGYARAGRLIDQMEQIGVVGPHEGSKPRQVLMSHAQWLERNMNQAD